MDKLKEIMELVSKFAKAQITYESVLDIPISEIDGDSLDRASYDVKRTHDALESSLRALLERNPLSHSRIIELQESHVGGISTTYPLDDSDWLNFARAIEIEHGIIGAQPWS